MKLTDLQLDERFELPPLVKAKITSTQIRSTFDELKAFFVKHAATLRLMHSSMDIRRQLQNDVRDIIRKHTGFKFKVYLTPKDFGSSAGYGRKGIVFKTLLLMVHIPQDFNPTDPIKAATTISSRIIHELTHHIQYAQRRSTETDYYKKAVSAITSGKASGEDIIVTGKQIGRAHV